MRLLAALATAAVVFLGLASPSQAGLLELPFDRISLHRDCSVEPCRHNGLRFKRIYVRDRYLRYDIHSRPAQYELRRTRVMVAPPAIVVTNGRYETDRWGGRHLVELPVGAYRVVRPARYQWVTQQVLVHPAQHYVTRRHPYTAYYPDTIVVSQP